MRHISVMRSLINGIYGLRSPSISDGFRGVFRQASNATVDKENILQYSVDEQTKILNVLNESPSTELLGYDVSKQRVTNLEFARRENGAFGSLEDVLTVPGIGSRCLEKLCNSILHGDPATNSQKESKKKLKSQSRTPLITPTIKRDQMNDLNMVIGIHLGIDTVSWAGISRDGTLDHWDVLPINGELRKIHPTVILDTAIDIFRVLPKSDAYILEDAASSSKTAQQQITALTLQLQRSQLSAMLTALLNTSLESSNQDWPKNNNRVYYLRSRAASKLFRTLIGSEQVSAQTTVSEIIAPRKSEAEDLHYTPISVGWETQARFKSKEATVRENMCQSLLLTMAFYDLVIHSRPQSLAIVNRK